MAPQRHEGADENDDRQRNGQRYLQDQQSGADRHRIHQRHDGGAADVAAQDLEGPLAGAPQHGLAAPENGRRKKFQILAPSFRKKNRITTMRAEPARNSVTTDSPVMAPERTWLLAANWIGPSRA